VRQGEPESSGTLTVPPGSASPPPWRSLFSSPHLRRLYAWIAKPFDDLPPVVEGRVARIALALVGLLAAAFVVFFTAYLWSLQDAYLTHAEDLGIMDQALWNTVHGAPLHQTICNIVSDTNCLGDISRLAIHFEPIMLPISLLYLIAPSPKTIQFFQALVVAAGAFPAYWLASRKLRSAFAGVVFAAVYLLFPSLEAAITYDFHAVTLAAAFLMFALYFMLSRNNVGLVIACLLALSTKEEIVVDVAMIALCILLFQRRWRLSAGLLALSIGWLLMELAIMHAASPVGHSPTASRYAYLGHGPAQAALYILTHPVQLLRQHVFEAQHFIYLRVLFAPLAYLAILSPLTLILAVPALGINLLSTDPSMYSGTYQYNAEIVPVLILSTIQAVAYLSEAAGWLTERMQPILARMRPANIAPTSVPADPPPQSVIISSAPLILRRTFQSVRAGLQPLSPSPYTREGGQGSRLPARVAMLALTLLVLGFGIYEQHDRGYTPLAYAFTWPQATAHSQIANSLLSLIPPDASVSAQSDLVPHVSHRRFVYMYPYHGTDADYVFLDVTGNLYPYVDRAQLYDSGVEKLLDSGSYHIVAATDGYILLARGSGAPPAVANPYGLPGSFFSFVRLGASAAVPHSVDISYGSSLHLVGYQITPAGRVAVNTHITVTTYWRVTAPLSGNYSPQLVFDRQDGSQAAISDFAATAWLPMNLWQPGQTYAITSWPLFVDSSDFGRLRIGARVMDVTNPNAQPTALLPALGSGSPNASITLFQASQAVFFDQVITR
jgi:uncharacterized membrane protein